VLGKKLIQPMTDWTFHEFIPEIKMALAKDALARNQEVYAKDLSAGKITRDQLLRKTAREANAAFGELNYTDLGRNPTLQHFLRLTLLAPDFLEARARFVGQALKPYGREQQLALLRGAVGMFVMARLINSATGEDDPVRRPFSVIYKGREYGLRTIQGDLLHLVTSPRTFAMGRVSPLVGKTGLELLTGRDYKGDPITNEQMWRDIVSGWKPVVFRSGPDQKLWESFAQGFGITEKKYRSAAMEKAREFGLKELPRGPVPEAQLQKSTRVRDLIAKQRGGEDVRSAVREEYRAGKLSLADVDRIVKSRSQTELQSAVAHLKPQETWQVYQSATADEQREIRQAVAPKGLGEALSRTLSPHKAMLLFRMADERGKAAHLEEVAGLVRGAKNLTGEEKAAYRAELQQAAQRIRQEQEARRLNPVSAGTADATPAGAVR
jgi:hypothetical protein